jgi:hypothetical protein
MSTNEEIRMSAEPAREQVAPVLPTVNPEVEKAQLTKPGIHPAFYVA